MRGFLCVILMSLQKKVFVKVNFLKVTDIDTIKEVFHADVFVQTRWREPALDHSKVSGSAVLCGAQ